MAIPLTNLLKKVPGDCETKVTKARDRTRALIQEALRAECRLVFRTSEESEKKKAGAQVPVKIDHGHPDILDGIRFTDDLEEILLLARYRRELEQTKSGSQGLLLLQEELSSLPDHEGLMMPQRVVFEDVHQWTTYALKTLENLDPLKKIMGTSEDILGVYEYRIDALIDDEFRPNKAEIRLYWCVIGLVSSMLGCTVEDLTVVVLAHELSHAYTQLGADIEGRRWPASNFAETEPALKEGLAQYYTERVLQRIAKRYPGALKAYRELLPRQPEIYRSHQPWVEAHSPEAVRLAMLEVRRSDERTIAEFNRRLDTASENLDPTWGR